MREKFPKVRPPLPARIAQIYQAQYLENRSGGSAAASLSQRMEGWMHRRVAADVTATEEEVATLELGAGTLNQLDYEPQRGDYDVVEPFADLYRESLHHARVRSFYGDIAEVPGDRRYGRITSCAVLEHLCDLPAVIARCCLLLEPQGRLRCGIPSEGTLLWYLGWRLTTGLEFWLRHRLDYGDLMRHEHVNTAREIEAVLGSFFRRVELSAFGLGRGLSLYQYLECSQPDRDAAAAYLASQPSGVG